MYGIIIEAREAVNFGSPVGSQDEAYQYDTRPKQSFHTSQVQASQSNSHTRRTSSMSLLCCYARGQYIQAVKTFARWAD